MPVEALSGGVRMSQIKPNSCPDQPPYKKKLSLSVVQPTTHSCFLLLFLLNVFYIGTQSHGSVLFFFDRTSIRALLGAFRARGSLRVIVVDAPSWALPVLSDSGCRVLSCGGISQF